MKIWKTLLLALVVAGFGAYLWLVEKPAAEKADAKQKIVEVDRDAVIGIELQYPDSRIKLSKTDGRWRIVEPLATDADEPAVKTLIGAIADAELKKTVDDHPANLAPFGLDKPQAVVRLDLGGGKQIAVELGKTAPIGATAYARRPDDAAVLLTTASVATAAKREVKDLRDKAILDVQDDDVQEITLRPQGGPAIVLRRSAEGAASPAPGASPAPTGATWTVIEPRPGPADVTAVRGFLSSIRSLRAQDFIDDPSGPGETAYGLTPAHLEIDVLVGKDRAKKTLQVGGPAPDPSKKQMYVKRGERDTVYVVGDFAKSGLEKTANDFRDKTILAFDKTALLSVKVDRDDGKGFTLKKDGDWAVTETGDRKAKASVAGRFIDDLRDLKGADVISETGAGTSFGLDHPTARITLLGANDTALGTIAVARAGEGPEKKIYVSATGSPVVYTLRDYVFERIDKKKDDFLETPAPSPGSVSSTPEPGAVGSNGEQDDAEDEAVDEGE